MYLDFFTQCTTSTKSLNIYLAQTSTQPVVDNECGDRSTVDNRVDTEFYIASVGTEDTGTYNCSATNQRGTRQTNYEVTVEEKAIFTSKLEDQRLMELSGGVASFKCLTHGNPSPKIDWIINGQQWAQCYFSSCRERSTRGDSPGYSGDVGGRPGGPDGCRVYGL
ncbi:neural cell adhesion molecule L1-like [Haliotis rufescens]|uniref:neural cell adhesion molecule L1-like n=1 Tax=Haliotis rufescens TaxID=6454 RepID=UPI001EB064DD|nr:neural cell adhesion molecule L1-like [Haliotis rufescens]